ncbi:Centrosomal protein [Pristimantis euphronides]
MSFQPIRSQVAIPTAHVVPCTIATSSGYTRLYDRAGLSIESAVHSFTLAPSVDPSTTGDARKFEMPNIEPTMNQSLLNTLCTDDRPNFPTAIINRDEPYKALPESKEMAGVALTPRARCLAKHLQSQDWRPDSCSTQPAAENSWKLAHQQQYADSLRKWMEKLQLVRDFPTAPVYSAGLHPLLNEWERGVTASDNILLEKELMLERQRQHIAALEQKLREGEMQVHSTLLNQSSPYNMCFMQLQDLQREVTFLRAQFAEKNDSASRQKAEMEKTLCAMEAESRGLREAMKEAAQKYSEDMKRQEERVKGREQHINSLKKKCQKEAELNKDKQQRIATLERYVADLPTALDQQKQELQIKKLKEQNQLLQEQMSDVRKKLGEAQANCREREAQLIAQNVKGQEHLETIENLQTVIKKLEMMDCKEDRRLAEETNSLKLEVETLHREKVCLQKVGYLHDLEEQVCQEAAGQALKAESEQKEAALQKLKASLRDLATQNQDLMECNVAIQEQLRLALLKATPPDVKSSHLFTLYKELNRCQKDLRSICCLLSQRVQGADPNLSTLLGVHSTPSLDEQEEDFDSFSFERCLNGMEKLKKDIEELRTTISDCYAQDMGDNCITQ